jgi:hypothetical protein
MEWLREKIADDPEVGNVDLGKLDVGFEAYPGKVIGSFYQSFGIQPERITTEQAEILTKFIVETLLRFAQVTVLLRWKRKRKKIANEEFQEFLRDHPSFRGIEQQTLDTYINQGGRSIGFSIN